MVNLRREYQKEWYNKNKERVSIYRKEYRLRNKEKIKKYKANYMSIPSNKKKILESDMMYREKNHDNLLKNHREYNKKNREIINFKGREEFKKPEVKLKNKLHYRKWYQKNKEGKIKGYYNKNKQKENERRKELGLPLIGEGFRKEIEMFVLLKRLFPNDEIQIHNKTILNGLELDTYIPSFKLAFEYQGKQHFLPCVLNQNTLYFQTEEELEIYKWRDKRKIELCKEKGIILIHINFNEKLSEQLILQKLKEKNISCIQTKI